MQNYKAIIKSISQIESGTQKVMQDILKDISEKISQYMYENNIDYEQELFEIDDFHEIYLEKLYIHIPMLGIKIHEFIYCIKQDGAEEFEADYDGWMFFDSDTNELLYDEGYSSLEAAISNGFSKQIAQLNIEELPCEVFI